jgi:uncharacterized protein YlaI
MMRVKCVLCEKIETIIDDAPLAKKLRNRPIHTYMCQPCSDRIADRTNEHLKSENFRLYRAPKNDDGW